MIYWYRDKQQQEIDLIIERDGKLHPVEIKLTSNPHRSMLNNFELLPNRGRGALICMKDSDMALTDSDYVIPVSYL